nr:MAG TPA: hypothetical protein [Bacteriophage sp.]
MRNQRFLYFIRLFQVFMSISHYLNQCHFDIKQDQNKTKNYQEILTKKVL